MKFMVTIKTRADVIVTQKLVQHTDYSGALTTALSATPLTPGEEYLAHTTDTNTGNTVLTSLTNLSVS